MKLEDKKTIIIVLLSILVGLLLLFTSCKKEPITPGNYAQVSPQPDTTNWQDQYSNGGGLPNWGTGNQVANSTSGTKWVLTDVYNNYAHIPKNDTITFIDNTHYRVNSDTTNYIYSLYETMGNSTLQFNTFMPINGLNLSCNNFNSSVFSSTPINGTIQLNLKDIFNTSNIYTSTFKKI